jgi:hypothetical protein
LVASEAEISSKAVACAGPLGLADFVARIQLGCLFPVDGRETWVSPNRERNVTRLFDGDGNEAFRVVSRFDRLARRPRPARQLQPARRRGLADRVFLVGKSNSSD